MKDILLFAAIFAVSVVALYGGVYISAKAVIHAFESSKVETIIIKVKNE